MKSIFLTLSALAAIFLAGLATTSVSGRDFLPVSSLPVSADFPDPLVQFDGNRVTTKRQWWKQRRPELMQLFQHYEYGNLPPKPAKIRFTEKGVFSDFLDGKATLKLVEISFGEPTAPRIDLMLVLPNSRGSNRVPVFLGMNFAGNHSLTTDKRVPLAHAWVWPDATCPDSRATEASRGIDGKPFDISQVIDRGYAFATFCYGDVDADSPTVSDGVYAWLDRRRKVPPSVPESRGSIAAWAWGLHRSVDYLMQAEETDLARIALFGHSRLGKAAILAAAFDSRVALVIPIQAGQGGTSPTRTTTGETVTMINRDFPHWFNAEFKKFNDQPERLPFDHHALIALVAPRPVLLATAESDEESNPPGQFKMLSLASRVYEFLGEPALEVSSMPPIGKLVASRLGYFIRYGQHEVTPEDWKVFLDFADAQMPKKSHRKP